MSPGKIGSALAMFEANISKNGNSTSTSFITNVCKSPTRARASRRASMTTVKQVEDQQTFEKIVGDDYQDQHPLISPKQFHQILDAKTKAGLPSLDFGLFDDDDASGGTFQRTEIKVTSRKNAAPIDIHEQSAVFEMSDDDFDFSVGSDEDFISEEATVEGAFGQPQQDAGSATTEETATSEETNSSADGGYQKESMKSFLMPTFEEQKRFSQLRGRKPVPASPVKLKDRMKMFQANQKAGLSMGAL